MINNRQNGRRRGRNGQPQRNGTPGGPDRGSRVDNRARGNAAQLLEKYKSLARDAQMQGDRVNTEYYLQFADHYFRVLSENRSRFEEQRPQRRDDYRDEGDGEGEQRFEGANGVQSNGWDDGDDRGDTFEGDRPEPEPRQAEQRRERAPRFEQGGGDRPRQDAPDRQPRYEGERQPRREELPQRGEEPQSPQDAGDMPVREQAAERAPERRPRRAPRVSPAPAELALPGADAPERIEIDRLPQGFGTATETAEGEEPVRPRRRAPRRPRAETGTAEA